MLTLEDKELNRVVEDRDTHIEFNDKCFLFLSDKVRARWII